VCLLVILYETREHTKPARSPVPLKDEPSRGEPEAFKGSGFSETIENMLKKLSEEDPEVHTVVWLVLTLSHCTDYNRPFEI
jgi:hypothetical protein